MDSYTHLETKYCIYSIYICSLFIYICNACAAEEEKCLDEREWERTRRTRDKDKEGGWSVWLGERQHTDQYHKYVLCSSAAAAAVGTKSFRRRVNHRLRCRMCVRGPQKDALKSRESRSSNLSNCSSASLAGKSMDKIDKTCDDRFDWCHYY